jgi:hypothetical protein
VSRVEDVEVFDPLMRTITSIRKLPALKLVDDSVGDFEEFAEANQMENFRRRGIERGVGFS